MISDQLIIENLIKFLKLSNFELVLYRLIQW